MTETAAGQPHIFAGRQQAVDIAEDADLTRVGPGTPCGEYLRRFWQPVAISSELGALPLKVRMLGEDLLLIRTQTGEVGLLGRHCCHRGTSLEYGIITDEGISCCYHGWHFSIDGTILDTPNDPGSRIRHRLRQTAYPTREYKGVIFAYLGPPEAVPAFPRFDTCEDPETELVPFSIHYPCNWLQCLENTQDPVHSVFLHTRISGVQFAEAWGALNVLDFVETPIGMMTVNSRRWKDHIWVRTNESNMPNMNQVPGAVAERRDGKEFSAGQQHPLVPRHRRREYGLDRLAALQRRRRSRGPRRPQPHRQGHDRRHGPLGDRASLRGTPEIPGRFRGHHRATPHRHPQAREPHPHRPRG